MPTKTTMEPKIMIHHGTNTTVHNTSGATETTQLIPQSSPKSRHLSYGTIVFLMVNRSLNLVLYKAFTTFSWYFSQDFSMNYTLFALIAVMNFPGNLLNIAVVPYYQQFKVRYVIVCFELILAVSCLIILPWHTVTGLLIARLMTGFAITAARSEVNATIGAFTYGTRRTRAISIVEMSFGFSAMGFLIVGIVLQHFGWRVFFIGASILIVIISVLVMLIVPAWNIDYCHDDKTTKKKYSYTQLKETLMHQRLQLVFVAVLLNKIARNAFYYTFSKWLSESYGLGPQQAGYVTLFVAAGCLVGTTIVPIIVTKLKSGIHMACLLGSWMQVCAMSVEPIYALCGYNVTLTGASVVIFFYFCGCQIWYNNILDIMIAVTPRPRLLPAVNTILLAYGAFGGMIGTIGSTVWFEWGGEAAIALICAVCNVGVSCIVILLWIAHKQHPYIMSQQKRKEIIKEKKKKIDIVADSSSMALRIVDTESSAGQSATPLPNLQNINENQMLVKTPNL